MQAYDGQSWVGFYFVCPFGYRAEAITVALLVVMTALLIVYAWQVSQKGQYRPSVISNCLIRDQLCLVPKHFCLSN